MLWLAGWFAPAYRGLARRLLHIDIAPPAPGPRPAEPGPPLAWVLAHLGERAGWRAAAYVLLRLPYAIVMVCVGAGLWLGAAVGIVDPLLKLLDGRFFRAGRRILASSSGRPRRRRGWSSRLGWCCCSPRPGWCTDWCGWTCT